MKCFFHSSGLRKSRTVLTAGDSGRYFARALAFISVELKLMVISIVRSFRGMLLGLGISNSIDPICLCWHPLYTEHYGVGGVIELLINYMNRWANFLTVIPVSLLQKVLTESHTLFLCMNSSYASIKFSCSSEGIDCSKLTQFTL